MLSPENAEVLLDEFERLLDRLEEEEEEEPDPELAEEARRLLAGLDELPGPREVLEERIEGIRAWTEVLLQNLPPARRPGPGSPREVIEDHLFELREVVHEEQKGLGT